MLLLSVSTSGALLAAAAPQWFLGRWYLRLQSMALCRNQSRPFCFNADKNGDFLARISQQVRVVARGNECGDNARTLRASGVRAKRVCMTVFAIRCQETLIRSADGSEFIRRVIVGKADLKALFCLTAFAMKSMLST